MKKFYIVDKNGKYASADGKTRFNCLTGKALFDYLKTDEGSKKEFDIDFDDNGDEIGIEISCFRTSQRYSAMTESCIFRQFSIVTTARFFLHIAMDSNMKKELCI